MIVLKGLPEGEMLVLPKLSGDGRQALRVLEMPDCVRDVSRVWSDPRRYLFNEAEVAILAGIDWILADSVLFAAEAYSKLNNGWRVSIPTYPRPWFSGLRDELQQREFFLDDLSDFDGSPGRESAHQFGLAIHLGIRKGKASTPLEDAKQRYLDYGDMSNDLRYSFKLLVVDQLKRDGYIWGGDWRRRKDYEHFEGRREP